MMDSAAEMSCSVCGAELVEGGRFCAQCGAPVSRDVDVETTTDAIDLGVLEPGLELEGIPRLEEGTAMLVVLRGPNAGARYLLDRDVTNVGRHPESQIFLSDVTVSRRHCEFRREGSRFALKDLGSLNGSYVNGKRVDEARLSGGDELQIGRFRLMYLDSHTTAGHA